MNTDKSQPRLAATLAVVRDAPGGLEVLLLQRAEKGDHNSGAWVFPGGLVDAGDRLAHGHCQGLDEATANAQLGLATGGLDLVLAALREAFEEAGLLFADTASGCATPGASSRSALREGQQTLADVCQEFGLRLRPDRLHYIAHWLTPRGRPKRFDTRFFVAVLPHGQDSTHDDVETVQQVWLRPAQALAAENTRRLMTPTRAVLQQLGAFANTAALLAWLQQPRQIDRVLPRLAATASGVEPVLPGHAAWHEIGWLDPEGHGTVEAALRLGVPVALGGGVWRLGARATGANSYVLDCGADGWAVIDPGPDTDGHHDALLAVATGPVRWVGTTDGPPIGVDGGADDGTNSGTTGSQAAQTTGAAQLIARTGAQVIGAQLTAERSGTTHGSSQTQPGGVLQALPVGNTGAAIFHLHSQALLFTGTHTADLDTGPTLGACYAAPRHGFLRPWAGSNPHTP